MDIDTGRTGRVLAAVAAILAVVGLLSGCTVGSPNPNMVRGSGNVITEQRQVSGLSEVVLTMSGDLTIEQNGTEGLTIEGEDNIVPLITTDVSGNRLTIGTKNGSSFSTTRSLRIRLSVKNIGYIGDTGSGSITMAAVQGDRLQAETTGSGSITLASVSAKNYTAKMTGSGGITASGSADNLDVTGTGSGSFDGRNLQSKSAKVALSGSGGAMLRVSDTLDASVSGSGSVRYLGNPTVTKHDTGSGEIIELR